MTHGDQRPVIAGDEGLLLVNDHKRRQSFWVVDSESAFGGLAFVLGPGPLWGP